MRTLLETVAEVAGPEATAAPLQWRGPTEHRVQRVWRCWSPTIPTALAESSARDTTALDGGQLGIAALGAGGADGERLMQGWTFPALVARPRGFAADPRAFDLGRRRARH